jgi:cell division protein FtsQ
LRKDSRRQTQRRDAPRLGERIKRGLKRLTLLAMLVGIVVAGWLVYQSPLFQVRTVAVNGTQTLDPAMLASVSGLKGQNILQVDAEAAKQRLLALPGVADVSVHRQWPGKMVLDVTERQAWGYWQIKDQTYVIDDQGVVLDDVRPDEGAPTVVQVDSEQRLAPGDRVDADAVALSKELIDEAPTALQRTVTGLEYSDHSGLTVSFDGGLRATFGDSHDLDYKLSVLYVLLDKAQTQGLAVNNVDLRFGETVSFSSGG